MKEENKESQKIVLVLPNLKGGGAERVMINLANDWVKKAYDVTFIVGKKEGEFVDLISSDIRIIDLNTKRLSRAVFKIARTLKDIRPDVVLSTLIYCNALTALAYKISRIPSKLYLREATTPSKSNLAKSKLKKPLLAFAYRLADGFIAVSEGVKQDMMHFYGIDEQDITTIGNPIVSEEIYQLGKEPIDHPFYNSKEPVIVTLGKVSRAKDYETLIEAFQLLRKSIPARLLIIGSTDAEPERFKAIKEKIAHYRLEEQIDFCGFQINPFPYLANADLFVLSSIYEGSPGALIQAMALNGNLVSTDCPSGPREILQDGKFGELVPIQDPVLFSQAMLKQLKGPKKDPIPESVKKYTIDHSSGHYLKLFQLA